MEAESISGIVVVRSDDSLAHVYPDISQVLASLPVGPAEDQGGVEFFSTAGHRLAPVFERGWLLRDLVPTSEPAQPDLVLQRLRATVRNMKDYLRDNATLVEKAGLTVEDGLARLPSMRGASLEAAVEAWGPVLGHDTGSHRADPWHNFWVHAIF